MILQDDIPTSYNEAKDMMEDLGQVLATIFTSPRMPRNRMFRIIDCLVGAEEDNQVLLEYFIGREEQEKGRENGIEYRKEGLEYRKLGIGKVGIGYNRIQEKELKGRTRIERQEQERKAGLGEEGRNMIKGRKGVEGIWY